MGDAPLVVDVKPNSLDDGPGIRSVVFFKGCPLRCSWCQNPEAIAPAREVLRDPGRCSACGCCREVCPAGRARPAGEREEGPCEGCARCVEACPGAGRRIAGRGYAVDELAALLLRDEPFYRHSGGGVTFSGGEPALWPGYAGAVATRLAERGVHVLLETAGHYDSDAVESLLLPHLRAVYFDLKLVDPAEHRRHTGRGNERILENLRRLAAGRGPVELLPRLPLVPGITDTDENLAGVARLLVELDLPRVAALAYNPLWLGKRRGLGLELTYDRATWMSAGELERARERLRRGGLEVIG
jgi:pyruvate formate lyase activating enzyme